MDATALPEMSVPASAPDETFDVLIVGAGMSGIGSAYHLSKRLPHLTFAVLEAQDGFGGTWRTHRFPGIRSDSDLHTFGYSFKPWTGPPIATAAEIKAYLEGIIAENGLDRFIRYGRQVLAADWSEADRRWTVTVRERATGATRRIATRFLWMCQGYYRHDAGHVPDWPGMADFPGTIVHPQTWPEDLDTTGKRVVVIGSGATAATLVPALAGRSAHVTMLQRSPTYFRTGRNAIELAETLRQLQVDESWIHEIVRRKILFDQDAFTRQTYEQPERVKAELIGAIRAILGPDYDVETHFTPRYRPWHQRIAFVPDADLFHAIRRGEASVVTGEIERFTSGGIRLRSGEEVPADIVATATGFRLSVMGDIPFSRDGAPIDFAETVTWRGRCSRACRTSSGSSAISAPAGPCAPTSSPISSAASCRTWRRGARTSSSRCCPRAMREPAGRGPTRRTLTRAISCATSTACRRRDRATPGGTARTTGPTRTPFRPSTSTIRPSATPDGLPERRRPPDMSPAALMSQRVGRLSRPGSGRWRWPSARPWCGESGARTGRHWRRRGRPSPCGTRRRRPPPRNPT